MRRAHPGLTRVFDTLVRYERAGAPSAPHFDSFVGLQNVVRGAHPGFGHNIIIIIIIIIMIIIIITIIITIITIIIYLGTVRLASFAPDFE